MNPSISQIQWTVLYKHIIFFKKIKIVDARRATCFLIHAYEMLFSSDIRAGFYLRIEPLYNMNENTKQALDLTSNNYLTGKKTIKSEKKTLETKNHIFQFRYNPLISQYIGENIENSNYVTAFESRLDKSGYSYAQDNSILDASYISEVSNIREKAQEVEKSHVDVENAGANFVNYGQNIKLYRLIKNNIVDNEKFIEDESILYEDDEDNDSKTKNEMKALGAKKEEEEQDDESYGKI